MRRTSRIPCAHMQWQTRHESWPRPRTCTRLGSTPASVGTCWAPPRKADPQMQCTDQHPPQRCSSGCASHVPHSLRAEVHRPGDPCATKAAWTAAACTHVGQSPGMRCLDCETQSTLCEASEVHSSNALLPVAAGRTLLDTSHELGWDGRS